MVTGEKKILQFKKFSLITEGKKSSKHFTHLSCTLSTGGAEVRGAGRPVTFKMISKAKVPVKT